MKSRLLFALASIVLFVSVFGQKCRFSEDELPGKLVKFQTECLDKGFRESTMEGCRSTVEKNMKKKSSLKKCSSLDQYLNKCGIVCTSDDGHSAESESESESDVSNWQCYDYTDADWQWKEENEAGQLQMCEHAGGRYKGPGPDDEVWGCGDCWCCKWSEWKVVTRGTPFKFDTEQETLEVMANGTNGYDSMIELSFYGDGGSWIGDVIIHMQNWRYETDACGSQGDLLGDRQDWQSEQVWWTFKINRDEQGHHRITALCNLELALDITMSEENCENWSEKWSEDIMELGFPVTDTASDFYNNHPHVGQPGIRQIDCPNGQFACANGVSCIEMENVCDGEHRGDGDCWDGSDESDCDVKDCADDMFPCNNGLQCIEMRSVCNGEKWGDGDCWDGSDENNCDEMRKSECPDGQFHCANGIQCIEMENVCDGVHSEQWAEGRDCWDGSDESDCDVKDCPDDMFACNNGVQCIEMRYVCNGEKWGDGECWDGSDESDCEELAVMGKPDSAIQSSTLAWSGKAQSADLAIDGDMDTSSHTNCAWNTDVWYMMRFDDVRCFSEVVIVNAYLNYNAYRMQDLGVHVRNTETGTENLCGVLRVREDSTIEGQTYRVPCDGKCGNSVTLRVRHDRGDYSYMGCIHMNEVEVHYSEPCDAGDYMTDDGCEQCPENTWSEDEASSCSQCPDGQMSDAGSSSQEDCDYEPCDAGHYMTDDGCEQCPGNTWSEDGASSCSQCPDGQISAIGSSSHEDCHYAGYTEYNEDNCPICYNPKVRIPSECTRDEADQARTKVCDEGEICVVWLLKDPIPKPYDTMNHQKVYNAMYFCGSPQEMFQFKPRKPGVVKDVGVTTIPPTGTTIPSTSMPSKCGDQEDDFRCFDTDRCIYRSLVCDGLADCSDGSDEVDCPEPCDAGHYMTDDGCEQCPENTWSEDGASSCTQCPDGQISNAGSTSEDQCYDPCSAGEYMNKDDECEQCPENTWSEDGASSCSQCPDGQISNAGSTSQEDCDYEFFEPDSDAMYNIQKVDGPASGWYLTASSEKRNKNSDYVHTHPTDGSDQGEFWRIRKTTYRRETCYKIECLNGKNVGRLLVVHGTITSEGDGRVLVHKTPYNRDEDECWMFEPVTMEDGETVYQLKKAAGRHQGKYMVAINRNKKDEDWIWADVTDREEDNLWRIIMN